MANKKAPFIYKHGPSAGKKVERLQFTVTFTLNDMTGKPNTREVLTDLASDIAECIEERVDENYDEMTATGIVVKIDQ